MSENAPISATILEINDKKAFTFALELLPAAKTVSISMDHGGSTISSLSHPYIFIKIPPAHYRLRNPVSFSANPKILVKHLNSLPSPVIIASDVLRIVDTAILAATNQPVPNEMLYDYLLKRNAPIDTHNQEYTDTHAHKSYNDTHNQEYTDTHNQEYNHSRSDTDHLYNCTDHFDDDIVNTTFTSTNLFDFINLHIKWYSFIDIPIGKPYASMYRTGIAYPTRLILENDVIGYMPLGRVNYTNSRDGLIISKDESGFFEKMIVGAKYLERGYLDVSCNNGCFEALRPFASAVSTVIVCFSEEMMSVKVAFSTSAILFEAQVPCYLKKNFE